MFSFFKKKKKPVCEAPRLKVDLHSHLIPGIDDGSQSMEESLLLLQEMKGMGYQKVITTPHIMSDTYRNTPEIIEEGLADLRQAAREEGIDIIIEAAAEYYLDDGFLDLLHKGDMLVIQDRYLLFETSYVSKPLRTEEMIFEMVSAGYIPLMAHPERYRYIKNPEEEYRRWKELGVLFQVNINSFGGHYGKSAYTLAHFLSTRGMIDYLGSDTHHMKHLDGIKTIVSSEEYAEIFVHNTIANDSFL